MARTDAQRSGDAAEALVCERLLGDGWRILARQLRVGRNELDIVAVDPGPPSTLVAVEVRWRGTRSFGLPEETFDRRKRARVRAGLLGLVALGRLPDGTPLPRLPVRGDLVVVEPALEPGAPHRVRHHRDALVG